MQARLLSECKLHRQRRRQYQDSDRKLGALWDDIQPPLLLLLLAGWSLPAGLRRCCCRVNVTPFSRVTLIRQLQSTWDVDHFHARELPCSRVEFRDDPISGRRGDSGVPYSFIYRDI